MRSAYSSAAVLVALMGVSVGHAQTVGPVTGARVATVGEGDLVDAYQEAKRFDPQFRSAAATRDVNVATANQALTQYLPSAQYQMTSVPNENTTRQIVSVTQPVVSVDRYALLRQRGPRREFADATFAVADQNLADRLLTEVCNYINAGENARLNQAKIDALGQQNERAQRLYSAGQGTVTDARDIQVRYEQALANKIILESEERAAATRIEAITGRKLRNGEFRLGDRFGPIALEPLATYKDDQTDQNPAIRVARANERIGRWEALRAKGSLLPTVGLNAVHTRSQGISDSYVGVAILAPLAPGGLFQVRSANAAARKTTEDRRQAEVQASVDLQRLYDLVDGGRRALEVSAKAITAAELSVEANSKSYEGGVRTNVDVVNAIQVLYEVKSNHVTAATQLAQNVLALLLLSGADPQQAMAMTQRFLFPQ